MGPQGKVIGDSFFGDPKNTINTSRWTSKHKPLNSHFLGHIARIQCNYRNCCRIRFRRNLLDVYRIVEMERTLKYLLLQPLRCQSCFLGSCFVVFFLFSLSPLPTCFFLVSILNRDHELTHWKRLWCWEGLGAGGKGDSRGWDGWMASPTRWTWVWVNSGRWW